MSDYSENPGGMSADDREGFITKALDLLDSYCQDRQDQRRMENHLNVFISLLRNEQQRWDSAKLWEESGQKAVVALTKGLDSSVGGGATRHWAELLEPLMRRCCTLVPGIGIGMAGDENLTDILASARLMPKRGDWPARLSKRPNNAPNRRDRPALLATARAEKPTSEDTAILSALLATERRNKHAHGQWPKLGWRERIETVEVILLTFVRLIQRHPQIERHAVYAAASAYAPPAEPSREFGWRWSEAGDYHTSRSTQEFAAALLARDWGSNPRLSVIGPRGVGLSTLASILVRRSVETDGGDHHPLFLLAPLSAFGALDVERQDSAEDADVDDFLSELLGADWRSWWVQRALEQLWLGIVVDDLQVLGTTALRRLVYRLESALRRYPSLRVLTLRPRILPAPRDEDQPGALGALGTGRTILVQGRFAGESIDNEDTECAEQPAQVGFWLDKGAQFSVGADASGIIQNLIERSLGYDREDLWIDFDPACRKAASVVALNALASIVGKLDESDRDADTIPGLDRATYLRCLYTAFTDVAGLAWDGKDVPRHAEELLAALDQALTSSGLVRKPNQHLEYSIALASIEDCAIARGFPKHIQSRWQGLDDGERAALITAFGPRPASRVPS